MARFRKQNVVIRAKVRHERRARMTSFSFKLARSLALLFAAVWGIRSFYRFLFFSKYFMIHSIVVDQRTGQMSSKVLNRVLFLNGRSIWKASLDDLSSKLRREFPALRDLRISRSFPDGIKISYHLRSPLALINDGETAVDAEGATFPLKDVHDGYARNEYLPVILCSSTDSLRPVLSFLKSWSAERAAQPQWLSTSTLKSITLGDQQDLTATLATPQAINGVLTLVWGPCREDVFSRKFYRFQQVWLDLQSRSLKPQSIDLRAAAQNQTSLQGDEKMLGRAIVRAGH